MMRTLGMLAIACAALCVTDGAAQAPYHPSPFGAAVVLQLTEQDTPIRGELIAATTDTVWVLDSAVLHHIPLAAVRRVEYKKFRSGASTAWIWGTVAGVVSGGALTLACASVEGSGCGGVFPSVLAPWLLWSLLGATSLSSSSTGVIPPTVDALQPYTRFPQGLPAGVDGPTLRVGISVPLPRP